MTHPNPFQESIFDGDVRFAPSSSRVFYPEAAHALTTLITSMTEAEAEAEAKAKQNYGQIRMVHCARAGFGKSHLLANVLSTTQQACILPISFNHETEASWQQVFSQVIQILSRNRDIDASGEVPGFLSETSRHLFAELVGKLVQKGIVPSSNPETSQQGMHADSLRMFDLKHLNSPIARWFKKNFKALAEPLAGELRNRSGINGTSCRFWIELLYRFELGDLDVISQLSSNLNSSQARQRLQELSLLVSLYSPIIMVFDNLDSFKNDSKRASKAAYIFSEIARTGIASLTIISINDDIWDSAFAGNIPDAVADRITDGHVSLEGIALDFARALLTERMHANPGNHNSQEELFAAVNLEEMYSTQQEDTISPRKLIRTAFNAWQKMHHGERLTAEITSANPATSEHKNPINQASLNQSANETLGRIRKMLREVNQRNPDKIECSPPSPKERISPWKQVSHNATPALREFARKREEIFQGENLLLDTNAMRHALELAGRSSPLIDYQEFDVMEGSSASCWKSPDLEILFGFEPAEQVRYWKALIKQAEKSQFTQAKVVVFTPEGTPPIIREGLNGEAKGKLDILELDRGTLASIAATRKVLLHTDSEEDTFTQIAPELDFLWRRITRPMQTLN